MRTAPLDFWAMGREAEVVAELLPAFHSRHPDIRVRVQQLPWTAAHEKLLTAYAGDALPDLCQLGNTWLPELSALDALEPLDAPVRERRHRARRLLRRHPRHQRHAHAERRPPVRLAVVRGHARALLSQRPAACGRPRAAAAELGRVADRHARSPAGRRRPQLRRVAAPQRARPALCAGTAARRAARRRRHPRRVLEGAVPACARLLRGHLPRGSCPGDERRPDLERLGRVRARPVRVLRQRALEHRRVPASPAARATGRLGDGAAAGS